MEKNLTILFFILAGFILLLILLNCTLLPAKSDNARVKQNISYMRFRPAQQIKHIFSDLKRKICGIFAIKLCAIVNELKNPPKLNAKFDKIKYFHNEFACFSLNLLL